MKKLILFCLVFGLAWPALAQDDGPSPNFRADPKWEILFETGDATAPDARYIGASPDGQIYVAFAQTGGVVKLDEKGNYLTRWVVGDEDVPISDLTVSPEGIVYVTRSHDIYRYTPEGELIDIIEGHFVDAPYYHMEFDANDELWIATLIPTGDALFHLDAVGNPLEPVRREFFSTLTGRPVVPSGAFSVDADGNILYIDSSQNILWRVTPDGEILSEYKDLIEMGVAGGLAATPDGKILLGRSAGFDLIGDDGIVETAIEMPYVGFVHDIFVGTAGRIYVLQPTQVTVMVYPDAPR